MIKSGESKQNVKHTLKRPRQSPLQHLSTQKTLLRATFCIKLTDSMHVDFI